MSWNRDRERKAGKAMTIGTCVYGVIFSILWCAAAAWMGAGFMLIFGIPFAGLMLFRLVVLVRKAGEEKQEREPWERADRAGEYTTYAPPSSGTEENGFCPYCGGETKTGYAFCPKCVRRLQ